MKLEKRFTLGGISFPILTDTLSLELKGHGRGNVLIRTGDLVPDLKSQVSYLQGYSDDQLYPVFLGVVHLGQEAGEGQYRLITQSLSTILELPAKFSLRHVTAIDLLKKISALTGLRFVYPTSASYMTKRIPNFYNLDTCRGALEWFAVWGIERGIWTQLPDGTIFWGSWDDSPFAQSEPVVIDPQLVTEQNPADRSFRYPVIPALTPGMLIGDDLVVEQIEIFGNFMRLRWLKLSKT